MRSIQKRKEPRVLADARRTAQLAGNLISKNDWPPEGMDAIREKLHVEQHGLCAYCCGHITKKAADRRRIKEGGMSVEHWIPRSGYKDNRPGYTSSTPEEKVECGTHTLEWSNLLGVCIGRSLLSDNTIEDHCDQSRKSKHLAIHPAFNSNLSQRFNYNLKSGKMSPLRSDDHEATEDINVLNLNAARLQENRASAIKRIRAKIMRDDSPNNLKRLYKLATQPENGSLKPYAPVIEWYIAKKLRGRGLSLP